MSLSSLPESTPVYVDGYGPSTVGELVAARSDDGTVELSDWERTLNLYRDLAALNTCRQPWEPRVSQSEIRAYHASRSTGDPPRLGST